MFYLYVFKKEKEQKKPHKKINLPKSDNKTK